MTSSSGLPVAIIGAGPIGLAAAAHLHERGEPFVILEAGATAGATVREWAHARMFSPWKYNIDTASARLLAATEWTRPPADGFPTGGDLSDRYLEPLARHPAVAPHLRFGTRVVGVARSGFDRMRTPGRTQAPFAIRVATARGEEEVLARAVIDASGTWNQPNPIGGSGLPALGERAAAAAIATGIPDVLGAERARYAGHRIAVVGSGHSAFNVVLDLVRLAESAPGTRVDWIIRKRDIRQLFGGGSADQLAERGKLGLRVEALIAAGRVAVATGFSVDRVETASGGVTLHCRDRAVGPVDRIIATTGFRPDFSALSEIRLNLDPIVEAPTALAPLIDPNVHSCGTVPPHGAAHLRHDDPDFYLVGMKSYGRAPTFLLMTGYEQIRSVVAALIGDHEAARKVELALPETGVCSTAGVAGAAQPCCDPGCCGEPAAVAGTKACCDDSCCP